MNSVNIIGNIGHDLELRYTGSGKAVLNFNIAVSDFRDETDWFRVTLWNKQAENTAEYCRKGSKVAVSGRLTTNQFTNKEGQEVKQVEIVGINIDFLTHQKESSQNNDKKGSDNPFKDIDYGKENPFESNDVTDINDGDLPFDFTPNEIVGG